MFIFERVCFVLRKDEDAYNYVLSKPVPPILHMMTDDEEIYEATMVERFNEREYPIVYELTDPTFNKKKERYSFWWSVRPSDKEDFRRLKRTVYFSSMCHGSADTDLEYFDYKNRLYPELEGENYMGSAGGGDWGVQLCSTIKFVD